MDVNANIFNSVHRVLLWFGGCLPITNKLPPEGRPFIMRGVLVCKVLTLLNVARWIRQTNQYELDSDCFLGLSVRVF